MNVVLISTYDLGRQPFGLASPAAWLARRGHNVTSVDLAVAPLPSLAVREAGAVAFHLPMHTATRLAAAAIEKVKLLNPSARLMAYGLYAPVNAEYLRSLGVADIFGGEFEAALAGAVDALERGDAPPAAPLISLDRLAFLPPRRDGLPALARYAKLRVNGGARLVGYTEASRGCKHRCRHCPVVPVYDGAFRVVAPEIVLEDIRRQVAAGARHITFGDPDFFNGPGHALRVVEALHAGFPGLTYDVTIKVEHLLAGRRLLGRLRETGCLFVTTAVESVEDAVLEKLEKGHTRADFFAVARLFRDVGLTLAPTFIPFTPWTTRDGYRRLLDALIELDLVENTGSVQLALRLLIPRGSRLLELDDVRRIVGQFDPVALLYRWEHADPSMDALAAGVLRLVNERQRERKSRREIFAEIYETASGRVLPDERDRLDRAAIPYLDEPWYC